MQNLSLFKSILVAVWLIGATGLTLSLLRYQAQPCSRGNPPLRWPDQLSGQLKRDRDTLLVFVHPGCPCTTATLKVLDRELSALEPNKVNLQIIFFRPDHLDDSWARTKLWLQAARLPGAQLKVDPGGKFSGPFGVETSGHVLLYSSSGELKFSGGVTYGRGHEGSNENSRRLRECILGSGKDTELEVFGCSLLEESACKEQYCEL